MDVKIKFKYGIIIAVACKYYISSGNRTKYSAKTNIVYLFSISGHICQISFFQISRKMIIFYDKLYNHFDKYGNDGHYR